MSDSRRTEKVPGRRPSQVSPARVVAFGVLRRIESESAYSSFLTSASDFLKLSLRDRAFCHELTLGVLRRRGTLDWIIGEYRSGKAECLEVEVALLLRMGVYQMLFMERVPPYAAISESVALCRNVLGHKTTGLVNALLRRFSRELKNWRVRLAAPAETEECQAIVYSHPLWLWRRWVARFGLERARSMAEANNQPPRVDFRLIRPSRQAMVLLLRLKGVGQVSESLLLDGSYYLQAGSLSIEAPQLVKHIHFQSLVSQIIPHLLPVRAGGSVLDLCAAPGGKSLLLAEMVGSQGRVVAMDRHHHRLSLLRERMNRFELQNILCILGDGEHPLPLRKEWQFILLDAPCSGLGTVRRNPEIRWRVQEQDLKRLHDLQGRLLSNAANHLCSGGLLLYSTCSTEPEENEEVLREFLLLRADFVLRRLDPLGAIRSLIDSDGLFRTYPGHPSEDGFFAGLLERR